MCWLWQKTYLPTICAYGGRVSEDYIRVQVRFAGEIQIYRETDPDIICSIYKYWLDPDTPVEKREQADAFWKDYFMQSKNILLTMLELEKIAFNAGNTLALALVNGSCRLV